MTVLNFPASPTVGKTYTANNIIYTWNGTFWAANNAQGLDARFVNVTGDTMTGNLTVPSINHGPLAGFRNLIINPAFTINQRGGTRTPGAAVYGFDRWRGASDGSNPMLEQIIEDAPPGRYTLSVVGGTKIATERISAHYANTSSIAFGNIGDRTLTFDFDGTTSYLAVFVPTDTVSVQVEKGEVATPHERRPSGTELALCQRYFQSLGVRQSTLQAFSYTYQTAMRVTPTGTTTGSGALALHSSAVIVANTSTTAGVTVTLSAEL